MARSRSAPMFDDTKPTTTPMQRYQLETETIRAYDQEALSQRADLGWRIVYIESAIKNIPNPLPNANGIVEAPPTQVWHIIWERPITE